MWELFYLKVDSCFIKRRVYCKKRGSLVGTFSEIIFPLADTGIFWGRGREKMRFFSIAFSGATTQKV